MNDNDISIIEDYSKTIESYIVLMSQIMYDEVSINYEQLENNILDYLHNKFPSMSVSKKELDSIIDKIYKIRNFNFKKEVECNLGKTKFELEDSSIDANKVILEEVNKLRSMFNSIKSGTNYCYLGLVDSCTQEIVGLLIRWHNNITFSKESDNARKQIRILIEENYKIIMNNMGEQLLLRIYEPLNRKYAKEKVVTYQK